MADNRSPNPEKASLLFSEHTARHVSHSSLHPHATPAAPPTPLKDTPGGTGQHALRPCGKSRQSRFSKAICGSGWAQHSPDKCSSETSLTQRRQNGMRFKSQVRVTQKTNTQWRVRAIWWTCCHAQITNKTIIA